MQLSLQLSKLQGTTSYFDGNMERVGVKSDTVRESHMVEWIERWPCIPRISGSIPGTGNLEKLLISTKVLGLTQKYHPALPAGSHIKQHLDHVKDPTHNNTLERQSIPIIRVSFVRILCRLAAFLKHQCWDRR